MTFLLDGIGADLPFFCDRSISLQTIGYSLAARLQRPPRNVLPECCKVTGELVRSEVLDLRSAP